MYHRHDTQPPVSVQLMKLFARMDEGKRLALLNAAQLIAKADHVWEPRIAIAMIDKREPR